MQHFSPEIVSYSPWARTRTLPKVSVGMAVTGISADAHPDCGGSGVSAMFWK